MTIGVVANPASGRDIRRLVAGASVFDNAEKGNMVFRLMVGLAATGVERVLMMPAASGLYGSLERNLHANAANEDRKSTRLNSSHANISYAVFCLKKKKLT